MKFYYVTNIFDLQTFDNETTALLKFFEASTKMHFVSLFLLDKRNLTIQLKWTVLHYANLNSSSINWSCFKLRAVKDATLLFLISYLCLF